MLEEKKNHESYGMIGISHVNCNGGVSLFGSSIKHDRWITLKIKTASVDRHLHQEWYHGKENLIEISLSAAQFAQFITTPNVGDGIPCTINRFNGKQMETPPYIGQNEVFNQEIEEDFSKVMNDSNNLADEAEDILLSKGTLKVSERQKLLSKIKALTQHINSNIPFLKKQFTRSMDKTVTVAKAEIEGFYTNMIMKAGVKAIEELNMPLLEEKKK